jgi:hypothetical protein
MARRSKTPDGPESSLAALHERRMELAMRRNEAEAAMNAAVQVVEGSAERRRQVLLAEARGEDAGVTVEQVDRERQVAEHAAADQRQRAEACRTVEAEIGKARDGVVDANPSHFESMAAAAREEAVRLARAADDAVAAAEAGYRQAGAACNVVWMSYKRRKAEGGPAEWPISDLAGARREVAKTIELLGRLGRWQEAREPRTSLSVREAREQIMETI